MFSRLFIRAQLLCTLSLALVALHDSVLPSLQEGLTMDSKSTLCAHDRQDLLQWTTGLSIKSLCLFSKAKTPQPVSQIGA